MKHIILILGGLLLTLNSFAQTPNWVWGREGIGHGAQYYCESVATDASGNVYITGMFDDSTITFGSITLTNSTFGSSYLYDMYIVKFNSIGTVLWAQSIGGTRSEEALSISTDLSGNIYVTGDFSSPTVTFGTTTLTNGSTISTDIFLVKYDPTGAVIFAKRAGGLGNDRAFSLSIDGSNNVYITGYFNSPSIIFGVDTLFNADITGNTADMFIAKYSSTGAVMWAKRAGGDDAGNSNFITTDASGNSYISGTFTADSIVFGTTTLRRSGGTGPSIFIVKYSPSGAVIWAKTAVGSNIVSKSASTDSFGNIYVTGSFDSTAVFGTDTLKDLSGAGKIFVVKYSPTGSVLLAKTTTGTSQSGGYGVKTDASNNVYLSGVYINQTLVFDTDTLILPNGGSNALFIIKCDSNLNVLCSSGLYCGNTYGSVLTADAFGNGYVAGEFGCQLFVGPDTLLGIGGYNVFVAKFNCNGTSGINELAKSSTIIIYPNPFTSQTTISFSTEQTNTTIKITDILGKEIKVLNFTGIQCTIEKGTMQAGIYFVQITDANKNVVNRKVVVQ